MKVHKCEQRSDEWFAIRKGKMTASNAQAIGNSGKGLDTYILELMAEYYAMVPAERYTNPDIERGIELEATARGIYELERGVKIDEVGFVEGGEFFGCSPDGLIGEDGGIEIKCTNNKNHFALMLKGESGIDSKYIWQIQMCLFITGRKWWDFVSYNPNFKNSLIVFRIKPDNKMHKKLNDGLKNGEAQIKQILKKMQLNEFEVGYIEKKSQIKEDGTKEIVEVEIVEVSLKEDVAKEIFQKIK